MRKSLIFALLIFLSVSTIAMILVYRQGIGIAVLNGRGEIAQQQGRLFYITILLMLIVVIPAFLLAFLFGWRYRAGSEAKYTPDWDRNHIVEAIWWGVPCVIIAILSIYMWRGSFHLDPYRPLVSEKKPIHIQVVALDWKWLFIYPEQHVASVNLVQFPKGVPISFELTADAPMNSFWIPELGGQIFAMPGMRTKLHLLANEAGEFRGSSANISGRGFAGMTFAAKATSQEEFERWLASLEESPPLTLDEYQRLALPSEYAPVSTYRLQADELFDWILMKYMMPSKDH